MPDRAYTVEPVVSTDEAGQETIQDFAVVGDHSATIEAFNRGYMDDFTVDSEGRYHHIYENVEVEDESSPTSYDNSEYESALMEANPDLGAATRWATSALSEDQIAEYDSLIDSGDPEKMHQAIDWLLEQYYEFGNSLDDVAPSAEEFFEGETEGDDNSYLSQETIDEINALDEEDTETLNNTIEELSSTEPDPDAVDSWQSMAERAAESGDEVMSIVAAATASYHAGEIDADQAIAYCLNTCNLEDLATTYRWITENM